MEKRRTARFLLVAGGGGGLLLEELAHVSIMSLDALGNGCYECLAKETRRIEHGESRRGDGGGGTRM